MRIKKIKIKLITAALLFFHAIGTYAIGDLGIGINIGLTYDPNNIENEISETNALMQAYKTANAGTKTKQINVPYIPVLGFNFRYNFNYLLFRFGGYHSRSLIFKSEGSIEISSVKNEIEIESYQTTFPVSIGLIVPLRRRTLIYFGAGLNLHFIYLEIKQSNPGNGFINPDDEKNRYESMFGGYHLILGAEFPISENYTLTVEWIRQSGISPMIESKDTTDERTINVDSNIIMFGINYYLSL